MNFKSLPELLDYFKDEAACRAYYENIRWPDSKVICPHCGHDKVYRTTRGFKCASSKCYKKFTVTVGTIFESSHINLRLWYAAIWLCTSHKKGFNSVQLGRELGIPQKTAWFLNHRVREMLKSNNVTLLSNTVEADETFIGGKDKNRHFNKRRGDKATQGKTVVFGLVERGGKVIAQRMLKPSKEEIQPIIERHVQKGSIVNTDTWYAYNGLAKDYTHETINHSLKVYVVGDVHTNTIEGFWSCLKRGLYGIYQYTSEKHINRYLDEFCARYNTRHLREGERFNLFLNNCNDRRLTYKNLVA